MNYEGLCVLATPTGFENALPESHTIEIKTLVELILSSYGNFADN